MCVRCNASFSSLPLRLCSTAETRYTEKCTSPVSVYEKRKLAEAAVLGLILGSFAICFGARFCWKKEEAITGKSFRRWRRSPWQLDIEYRNPLMRLLSSFM